MDATEWHDFAIACQLRLGYSVTSLRRLESRYDEDRLWRTPERKSSESYQLRLKDRFLNEVVPRGWRPGDADPVALWKLGT